MRENYEKAISKSVRRDFEISVQDDDNGYHENNDNDRRDMLLTFSSLFLRSYQ